MANDRTISSNDSVPNSLLALHWLQNHTLHFDAFRGGHYYLPNDIFGKDGIPYFFVEAPNGHLTSSYPIGTAIVSFPLYVGFFLWLKLSTFLHSGFVDLSIPELDLTAASSIRQVQLFEKLAGTVLTAAANVMFYLIVRLKFSRFVAIVAVFIYAFATLNWAISAQGLWAHTVSNIVLLSAILCLLKADRLTGGWRNMLLVLAGACCGLLPAVRPTSLVFSAAIVVYGIFAHRKSAIFLLLGTMSALLNAIWNVYYFGFSLKSLVVGGYSNLMGSSGDYVFTLDYAGAAFWGLLISPSRGFLLYSPILLFAIPGVIQIFRRRSDRHENLFACLAVASLILFFQYCVYTPWWGAVTYGTRFLVDVLPIVCYLICYFISDRFEGQVTSVRQPRWIAIGSSMLFSACLIFSVFVQTVGAFSDPHIWDSAPTLNATRLWDWQDSQLKRHARNLWFKIDPPIRSRQAYLKQLSGGVERVKDQEGRLLTAEVTATPSQEIFVQADLKNTGRVDWFGYDTGLMRGRTIVNVQFFDRSGDEVAVKSGNLYVAGQPQPGEATTAIGTIRFPQEPGEYILMFRLIAQRIGKFPNAEAVYRLNAHVSNR